MRKTKLIIILSMLFLSCKTEVKKTENIKEPIQSNSEQQVSLLKEDVNKIYASLKSMDSISKDIYGESTEGGHVKLFYKDKDTIHKIQTYYGEMGKRIVKSFYKDGKLIFVLDKDFFYKSPIYKSKNVEIDSISKNTYYLKPDGDILLWLENDVKRDINLYKKQKENLKILLE